MRTQRRLERLGPRPTIEDELALRDHIPYWQPCSRHKDPFKSDLRATCKACMRASAAYDAECVRQEAALTAPWDAVSAEIKAAEDALRERECALREASGDMNSAELRWMREAMAEQRAELASLRAENRLLRAEVARRAENEPCGSDDDDA